MFPQSEKTCEELKCMMTANAESFLAAGAVARDHLQPSEFKNSRCIMLQLYARTLSKGRSRS